MTKLCRQQAEVVQNRENEYVRDIGKGEARHWKFVRDKPIFSSERMLHKDYCRKSSVGGGGGENSGRRFEGAWRQDEPIGGKLPDVK
jgi:hypothetical protein